MTNEARAHTTRSHQAVTRALTMAACALAAWIPMLAAGLDASRTNPSDLVAWVSLDIAELLALTTLVHAAPRRAGHTRVVGIVAAGLFALDAIVDVASATSTTALAVATAMAVCAELPVALGCLHLALTHDVMHDAADMTSSPVATTP